MFKKIIEYKGYIWIGIKSFLSGLFKKLLDYIYILLLFFITIIAYYYFLGINYSIFTSNQIDNFIVNKLPSKEFTSTKYLVDIKGYGNKDLVVLLRPKNNENINVRDYSQENFKTKLFIFSKIEKNPIEKLLFSSNIYEKEFTFEFPFISIEDLENSGWEFTENPGDYQLYKSNTFFNNIQIVDNSSEFISRQNIIIHGINYHNWGNNSHYYGLLSYDFGGYSINPMIDVNEDYMGIGCLGDSVYDDNEGEKFCAKGINNSKIDIIINDEKKQNFFTHIISYPSELQFKDGNSKISMYLHNNDCVENKEYMLFPDDCKYSKYLCNSGNDQFFCELDQYNTNDTINNLKFFGEGIMQ